MKEFVENKIEHTNLPKDVFLGAMNLYLIGKYEAQIENYLSIIEYTTDVIKIRGKGNNARIVGKNLKIHDYTKSCMTVRGIIKEVYLY